MLNVIPIWLKRKYNDDYYWITYKAIGYKNVIHNLGKTW